MRYAPMMAVLAIVAAPASAQQGQTQGMDHGQMVGMDHGKMMNDPGNPYGQAEMDMHMKMRSAKATHRRCGPAE